MPAHPAALAVLLCAAFVIVGGTVATLGPSLPGLARDVGRPLPDLGVVLSAVFGGMLTGQITAGLLVDRLGVRFPIATSLAVFGAGVLVLPMTPAFMGLIAGGLVMGVGYGMASIGINTMASRLMPSRPGFILNLCNVWYAGGSVAGPFVASLLLDRGGRAETVLLGAGVVALTMVPFALWLVPPGRPAPRTDDPEGPAAASAQPAGRWRPPPALLLMSVVVMLYAGVEAGFGGWVASYVQLTLRETAARGALLTSLFWFAYLVGRIVATLAALATGPGTVLTATAVTVGVGGMLLGIGHAHAGLTTAAIAVLGLGVGPLYPSMFALVTARVRERPATAVAVVSSIGSIGAIAFPWIMGQALPVAEGRIIAWMPAGLGIGMVLALLASERLHRRAAEAVSRPDGPA